MVNDFLDQIPSPPIDPIPFWKEIFSYRKRFLRRDLFAALVVALTALPQSIAYAFLADLPTQAGVFAAIFGTIFTSAFGASRYLISGPSNLMAILLQSGTSQILATLYPEAVGAERDFLSMQLLTQIVFVIGVFQILAGFLQLGRVMQFASRSVVIGYTAAAAFAIFVNQIYPFFGIKPMGGYHPIYQEGAFFIRHLGAFQWTTLWISLGSLVLLIFFKKTLPRVPGPIVVFALASLFVFLLSQEYTKGIALVSDLATLKFDFAKWQIPAFDVDALIKVIPLAFALSLLSLLEATTIVRSYPIAKEHRYNDNQQSYGLGISNIVGAFIGTLPSSGSFSRTFLNRSFGAKTRFAAIFSGVMLAVFILYFKFLVMKIPLCALAALMVFTAYTMINFKHLLICLRSSWQDAFVVIVTFLGGLVFTLDVAFYIGVLVSIVLYLKQAGKLHLIEYTFNQLGKLRPMEPIDERLDEEIAIVHPDGDLFFGAVDSFSEELKTVSNQKEVKVIILQMINIKYIDASICITLESMAQFFKKRDQILILAGVSQPVMELLKSSGLCEMLGKNRIFQGNDQFPGEPTRDAYAYAKKILKEL